MKRNLRKLLSVKEDNMPIGTAMLMPIDEIYVTLRFRKFAPNQKKIDKAKEYLRKYKMVDCPITVEVIKTSEKDIFVLRDGYTRYLALKESGVDRVPVAFL